MSKKLTSIIKKFKKYAEITEIGGIARRYFIINAFDGALTTLGIIFGFFLAHLNDFHVIVITVLAGALAMGISGVWGAYLAERAERLRKIKELERTLKTDLSQSEIVRASKFATIFLAIIDGISPVLASIIGISPFLFFLENSSEIFNMLFYSSIGINLSMLFLLGIFLGKISQENIFKMGFEVVLMGIVVVLILLLINLI
jgi:predicted membrane protein (TIGR00267 family)